MGTRPAAISKEKRKATMESPATDEDIANYLHNFESLLSPTEVSYLNHYKALMPNGP